jgi:hypothetical protein
LNVSGSLPRKIKEVLEIMIAGENRHTRSDRDWGGVELREKYRRRGYAISQTTGADKGVAIIYRLEWKEFVEEEWCG